MKKIMFILVTLIAIFCICCTSNEKKYNSAITKALDDISFPSEVTENLNFFSEVTVDGYKIEFTWMTNNEAISSAGVVTRGAVDVTVEISAHIAIKDYKVDKKIATVVIKADEVIAGYERAITKALQKISFPSIVSENLVFTSAFVEDGYHLSFTWVTSNNAISSTGVVTRGNQDQLVTIFADITINDYVTRKTVAIVTVKASEIVSPIDQAIAKALENISFPSVVTDDLDFFNEVTVDEYKLEFIWKTSSDAISQTGVITRGQSDVLVTIFAEITIGDYTVEKVIAIVTVKGIDYDGLIAKALSGISFPSIIEGDLIFVSGSSVDGYDIDFVWKPSSAAISANGSVTRYLFDVTVIIFAEITIGEYKTIREIATVIVKKAPDFAYDTIYTSELLLVDFTSQYIELTNCPVSEMGSNFNVYREYSNSIELWAIEDLMIGLDNLDVYVKDGKIVAVFIAGDLMFTEIRVAIRKDINDIANNATLYHDEIILSLSKGTKIKDYTGENEYSISSGILTITQSGSNIVVRTATNTYTFDKRVIIEATSEPIKIESITRGGDYLYYGSMDISNLWGRLLLVNQVSMEEYLRKVVPSEMPSSWNLEALKAQAVAARTYGYREIYNRKYLNHGYVVDDSTSSQVYNNQNPTASTDRAVSETKGIVMFHQDEPIIAYYYSSSCGLTSNGNEVWITSGKIDEIGYLIGKNLATDSKGNQITVDTSSEASMLEFFKLLTFVNPGGDSTYHRWKISFTKTQLRNAINANIGSMSKAYPDSYPQLKDGKWVVGSFPSDIGNITDIFVSERGQSGVVISLTVVTDQLTFKIINQYNIRFTIRGRDAGTTVTLYTATSASTAYRNGGNNPSVLNSGFFALEWSDDSLTFYGGGNGHGVGMDQYGANYYGKQGKTFREILEIYYSNINFIDTNK